MPRQKKFASKPVALQVTPAEGLELTKPQAANAPVAPERERKQDVRAGKPSASKFDAVYFCAGSPSLIASVPEAEWEPETPDEMGLRGQRIHLAWETGEEHALAEDEQKDLQIIHRLEETVLGQWLDQQQSVETPDHFREQRLWYHDRLTLEPTLSGQFDRLYLLPRRALVLDAKTGWCKRLTPAEENFQAHVLAFLVLEEYGRKYALESVRVSFLKPKLGVKGTDTVEYGADELLKVGSSIELALWRAQQPYAPRTPGSHCFYCRANAHCPEAAVYAQMPKETTELTPGAGGMGAAEVDAALAVARLTPEACKLVWQKSGLVRKILDQIKTRLEELPADELRQLGLQLHEGRRTTEISQMTRVISILQDWIAARRKSAAVESLDSALSLSKSKLIENVSAACGMSKAEVSRQIYDDLLAPYITRGRTKGYLEEI